MLVRAAFDIEQLIIWSLVNKINAGEEISSSLSSLSSRMHIKYCAEIRDQINVDAWLNLLKNGRSEHKIALLEILGGLLIEDGTKEWFISNGFLTKILTIMQTGAVKEKEIATVVIVNFSSNPQKASELIVAFKTVLGKGLPSFLLNLLNTGTEKQQAYISALLTNLIFQSQSLFDSILETDFFSSLLKQLRQGNYLQKEYVTRLFVMITTKRLDVSSSFSKEDMGRITHLARSHSTEVSRWAIAFIANLVIHAPNIKQWLCECRGIPLLLGCFSIDTMIHAPKVAEEAGRALRNFVADDASATEKLLEYDAINVFSSLLIRKDFEEAVLQILFNMVHNSPQPVLHEFWKQGTMIALLRLLHVRQADVCGESLSALSLSILEKLAFFDHRVREAIDDSAATPTLSCVP